SFVARTIDSDRKHLTQVLRAAAEHPGTALVEIYQNCNIFNDGAFDALKDRQQAEEALIRLEHGQPIRFGAEGARGVVRDRRTGDLEVVTVTPQNQAELLVHDAHTPSPTTAFALSRLADPDTLHHTPIGVFRSVERPVYDEQMTEQLDTAIEQKGKGDLGADTLHHTPIGVFRSVERPVYDEQMTEQLDTAIEQKGKGDLGALLAGNDTWTVVG
ncbi:hypothetical protein ACLF5H_13645, partial [Streptomyces sp. LaBMicrA B280]